MPTQILIVEDDIVLHPMFEFIFKKKFPNCTLSIVKSYDQAIQQIIQFNKEKKKIDIILSDLYLEGVRTGVDLLCSDSVRKTQARTFLVSSANLLDLEESYRELLPETTFIRKPINLFKCQAMLGLC